MRLLLVDDQAVARESLAAVLLTKDGFTLVEQTDSARSALALHQRHRFDVAVIELRGADRAGVELIRELRSFADLRVLVLSTLHDDFSVGEAMRGGADGYLSKRTSLCDVIEGIRDVAQGRTAVSPDVSASMVRALHRLESPGSGSVVAQLTDRERQVLRLLALGCSAREVAEQLAISVKTVETHRGRLCAKVATHRVADLTRLAVRAGLIEA